MPRPECRRQHSLALLPTVKCSAAVHSCTCKMPYNVQPELRRKSQQSAGVHVQIAFGTPYHRRKTAMITVEQTVQGNLIAYIYNRNKLVLPPDLFQLQLTDSHLNATTASNWAGERRLE